MKYTLADWDNKQDWEGGFEGMAGHSGKCEDYDLPADFRVVWEAFVDAYENLRKAFDNLEIERE